MKSEEKETQPDCGKIWFDTDAEARHFIGVHGRISGRDSGLCEHCAHYPKVAKHLKRYLRSYACRWWVHDKKLEAQRTREPRKRKV